MLNELNSLTIFFSVIFSVTNSFKSSPKMLVPSAMIFCFVALLFFVLAQALQKNVGGETEDCERTPAML